MRAKRADYNPWRVHDDTNKCKLYTNHSARVSVPRRSLMTLGPDTQRYGFLHHARQVHPRHEASKAGRSTHVPRVV